MNVYIAGPLTLGGTVSAEAESRYRSVFDLAEEELLERGDFPINPLMVARTPATWQEAMRADLRALLDCDAILMLPNWQLSPGATLERTVAMRLGLAVLHWPI